MREIEFRGKDAHGEWVEGSLITKYDCEATITSSAYILEKCEFTIACDWDTSIYDCEFIEVDLDTIGQFTGLCDKNGTKIFEGDIFGDSKGQEIDVVVFEDGCFKLKSYGFLEYCLDGNAYEERWSELGCDPICNFCLEHDEILGNIHDNPELLEGIYE